MSSENPPPEKVRSPATKNDPSGVEPPGASPDEVETDPSGVEPPRASPDEVEAGPEQEESHEVAAEPEQTRQDESVTDARVSWRRLIRMGWPRLTRANLVGLVIALVLGFAVATQIQQTHESGLENLREDELVRVLDDVTQNGTRLASELQDLRDTRAELTTGAGATKKAREAAQERLDTLGVLAGTVPVRGPGIVVTITNPTGDVRAADLLDAVEELRDAGAEAMQIGDVRVVASTYLTDTDAGIEVSGHVLSSPIRILAIGDPQTMASAMDIPGGVTERVRQRGGTAVVTQRRSLDVTALHTIPEARYAQPVPEASASPSE